jgi:hypothetical protein
MLKYNYNIHLYEKKQKPKTENLVSQNIISFIINPQTVFPLEYSDNDLHKNNYKLTQTDRSFFYKIRLCLYIIKCLFIKFKINNYD